MLSVEGTDFQMPKVSFITKIQVQKEDLCFISTALNLPSPVLQASGLSSPGLNIWLLLCTHKNAYLQLKAWDDEELSTYFDIIESSMLKHSIDIK